MHRACMIYEMYYRQNAKRRFPQLRIGRSLYHPIGDVKTCPESVRSVDIVATNLLPKLRKMTSLGLESPLKTQKHPKPAPRCGTFLKLL